MKKMILAGVLSAMISPAFAWNEHCSVDTFTDEENCALINRDGLDYIAVAHLEGLFTFSASFDDVLVVDGIVIRVDDNPSHTEFVYEQSAGKLYHVFPHDRLLEELRTGEKVTVGVYCFTGGRTVREFSLEGFNY